MEHKVINLKEKEKINRYQYLIEFNKSGVDESYFVSKTEINNITCDAYNVFRRGIGQKIISFSLYGKDERYYKHLFGELNNF